MIDDKYKLVGLTWLKDYWRCGLDSVAELPVSSAKPSSVSLPVKLREVELPTWAQHVGTEGFILVPEEVCHVSSKWEDVNWWYVIYWYVTCQAEVEHERIHGPIHSYSLALKNWDKRMWKHAWVNRIAMFLNLWAEKVGGTSLTGNRTAEVILTHDLDAIKKTKAIRFKQAAFNVFNCIRCLYRLDMALAINKFLKAIRFVFSREKYNNIDKLNICYSNSIISRQIINVYGRFFDKKRGVRQSLIDPDYDVSDEKLVSQLKIMMSQGCQIGLHQSTQAWDSSKEMSDELATIENALGINVTVCRQHWLKFSFYSTWQSQAEAGLSEDMTLGFNNQIAFRNGCALPIDLSMTSLISTDKPFYIVPMVLMDSHLYDYEVIGDSERSKRIQAVLDELLLVGGTASVIWHPHTLNRDYGWQKGFEQLISQCYKQKSNE